MTRRETTTLLTVDGTLLHRETFELAASDRPISSFEVALPEKAVLWSTKVDGQPMRPLQRDGKVVLPIVPKRGSATTVPGGNLVVVSGPEAASASIGRKRSPVSGSRGAARRPQRRAQEQTAGGRSAPRRAPRGNYSEQVGELQQGLIGGVKPLPVSIPESGKTLVLAGVLPPERIAVKIDVKAKE